MIVTTKYFGTPLGSYGPEVKRVALPAGATVGQLLDGIARNLNDADKELLAEAVFMVNKVHGDRRTVLQAGDEVIIMHFLGGG